jgi:hypothetical protein
MINVRSEAKPIAIKNPGQCGFAFRKIKITAIEKALMQTAVGDMVRKE